MTSFIVIMTSEFLEELWIALYERQQYDVELLQLWLQSLFDLGYRFPEVIETAVPIPTFRKLNIPYRQYNKDTCSTTKSITFWTSDLHDGSRIDMSSVLASLGHKVIVAGIKRNQTPYPLCFSHTWTLQNTQYQSK